MHNTYQKESEPCLWGGVIYIKGIFINVFQHHFRVTLSKSCLQKEIKQLISLSFYSKYSTVQYSTVQYSTVQYSTVQYSTVQYSTVQYSTVQYSTTV